MDKRNRHDEDDGRDARERDGSRERGGEDRDTPNDAERGDEYAAEGDAERALTPREREERWPIG